MPRRRRSPSSPRCRPTCAGRRSSTPAGPCSPPAAIASAGARTLPPCSRSPTGAGEEPVEQVHVATEQGEVFALRHAGLAAVAVTERFALASLMFFDMRSTLRDLAQRPTGRNVTMCPEIGPSATAEEG